MTEKAEREIEILDTKEECGNGKGKNGKGDILYSSCQDR
jgi:hypothetical protein